MVHLNLEPVESDLLAEELASLRVQYEANRQKMLEVMDNGNKLVRRINELDKKLRPEHWIIKEEVAKAKVT